MKKIAVIIMICVAAGTIPLAGGTWNKGFPAPSLHPLYTKADLVFLAELVGTWQTDKGDTTLTFERFGFPGVSALPGPSEFPGLSELTGLSEAAGSTGYLLTVEVSGRKSRLEARLLRLGDELFLDLYTSDYFLDKVIEGEIYQPILPVHSFGRIRIEGDVLRFSTLQSCILICTDGNLRTTEAKLGLPTEIVGLSLVLSATTEQLQEFVLQHLDDYFSFKQDEFMRRVSPPQEEGSQKGDPESAGGNEDEGQEYSYL